MSTRKTKIVDSGMGFLVEVTDFDEGDGEAWRPLFESATSLEARERADPNEPLPELTTIEIQLRVNTFTYASVETIVEEIGESLGWLASDHDAIYDGRWRSKGDTGG